MGLQEQKPTGAERSALLPIPLALITLVAFLPALTADFVNWDDFKNFVNNPYFRGLGWSQLHWMWTGHLMGHYIPITWMTFGFDYGLWAMNPLGYHLSNVLWHCANAILFYLVARMLLRIALADSAASTGGAFVAALFFAVHPLRVESVAWVTERRDVVSGCFSLLTVLLYLQWQRSEPSNKRRYFWMCLGSFVLAVLSKEMAVTLPLVLLILDICPLRRPLKSIWMEKIPFFAVSLVDTILAFVAGSDTRVTASLSNLGWLDRFAIGTYGLAFYLRKTLLPFNLAPFYALTPHRMDVRAQPFLLSAFVVGIAVVAVLLMRRFRAVPAAALMYGVTLLPVIGIFQNGQQIVADRYSYFACLGWAILAGGCFAWVWQAWSSRPVRAAVATVTGVMILTLGILTWRQTATWHDSETLWRHALTVEPSFVAFTNLGLTLQEQGSIAVAIGNYRQAIQLNPLYDTAHNNLGGALLELKEWSEAEREFDTALQINPLLATSQNGWGYALVMEGRMDEAIPHFAAAVKIDPNFESARNNLDQALARQKQAPGQ